MAEEQNTSETVETVATDDSATEVEAPEETATPETPNDASDNDASDDDAEDDAPVSAASSGVSERSYYGNAGGQPELNDALSQRSDSNEPRKEVEGGRAYEIIYIARVGDAEATDATTTRLNELVDSTGGAIDNVRASETRRLAYPIKGEVEGIYTVVNTRLAPEHLPEIDRFFKLEESVVRHMITKEN